MRPVEPGQITPLRAALEQLAEQDPLISLRQRNEAGEISLRLYGEVQKEVMLETLSRDYGIGVTFGPTARSASSAWSALASMPRSLARLGIRSMRRSASASSRPSAGAAFAMFAGARSPLAFYRAIEETVHETFGQGLSGWEVTDGIVTLTQAGFWSPVSTAADFRKLTPLVLMQALLVAGTEVREPVEELDLEIPEDTWRGLRGTGE